MEGNGDGHTYEVNGLYRPIGCGHRFQRNPLPFPTSMLSASVTNEIRLRAYDTPLSSRQIAFVTQDFLSYARKRHAVSARGRFDLSHSATRTWGILRAMLTT